LPVLAIGAVGNQQIFNAYMLWVPDNVSLVFFVPHHADQACTRSPPNRR